MMKRSCKTSLGTSFIDFMYKRSLEMLVLPFFYIETFAAAHVVAFWIVRALIDLVGGATYCAYYGFPRATSMRNLKSRPHPHP